MDTWSHRLGHLLCRHEWVTDTCDHVRKDKKARGRIYLLLKLVIVAKPVSNPVYAERDGGVGAQSFLFV